MVSLPIFIMMIGILTSVSHITTVPWKNEPTNQSVATLSSDTSVTFNNPDNVHLAKDGDYQVKEHHESFVATQSSTGDKQNINMLIREPVGASGKLPAIVFMHGAGYGTSDNSFGDVAETLSSAGFVTVVIDKPVWNTSDVNRDYPASAKAYDQAVQYLRNQSNVDSEKVGIYATSESTWISAYLLQDDPKIAFQILLSPMVNSPRHSLGFLAAQDFALVGANPGYQSIVRRLFSTDAALFNLDNIDIDTMRASAYAIPTFVAYGSKDVMTAQVEGTQEILKLAHQANNWNVTVRNYPIANHVLRLGDEAQSGTPLADHYPEDVTDWAIGQVNNLTQTSERVAGETIRQSIAVPSDLHARPTLTVYMIGVHVAAILFILASIVLALVALGSKIKHIVKHKGHALGFVHGFGGILLLITGTTLATLLLFISGLGQVVVGVVKLAWGGAPEPAGMIYWSWPVIQIVSTLVVWAWSRIFGRLFEVASLRGLTSIHQDAAGLSAEEKLAIAQQKSKPVLASTRLGRALFVITTLAMFCILLVFAFWGLFVY
ncbi:alpha/beta hydrolase family protein [Bifidobacterium sp.]|jgi:acetyl esterase/lipase|uniref:alpha/beta hydrolase family protein n=1 Tax=Bifidobacterium sp. TaxID=41200 RepID=UPI0025C5F9BB|nr:alpha/beta hydrolase [Bifidobacterium sp.]MCI1636169.1 alpha/beta hydrolase [Bifidobacterium sp.]